MCADPFRDERGALRPILTLIGGSLIAARRLGDA
jgi:hypothetical protein